jgi:hypothetical protein
MTSTTMTPHERRVMAAHAAWLASVATIGREERSERARQGQQRRWERMVDPDGVLPPVERATRADAAMRSHMLRMVLISTAKREELRELRKLYGYDGTSSGGKRLTEVERETHPRHVCPYCYRERGRDVPKQSTSRCCVRHLEQMRREFAVKGRATHA